MLTNALNGTEELFFTRGLPSTEKDADGLPMGIGISDEKCDLCEENFAIMDLLRMDTQEKVAMICRDCLSIADDKKGEILQGKLEEAQVA